MTWRLAGADRAKSAPLVTLARRGDHGCSPTPGTGTVGAVTVLTLLPEQSLRDVVDLLVRFVEAAGALVIFLGAAVAAVRFVVTGIRVRTSEAFVPVRLGLGRFLELGLEFQLASDVLRTAIAPSFREIGQLAAVAAIRTALNYFLGREIREERAQLTAEAPGAGPDPTRDVPPARATS